MSVAGHRLRATGYRIGRCLIAPLVVAWLSTLGGVAQVRDTPAPTARTGTAVISGVVLDDQRQPVRQAFVRLEGTTAAPGGGGAGNMIVPVPARAAVTGADGRFAFSDLSAGRFALSAAKPSYIPTQYGAVRVGRPGTSIVLAEGARMTDLALTLTRGAVISGRVVGPRGEPLPGLTIRLLRSRFAGGARAFGPFPLRDGSARWLVTDDRGEYRIHGLEPGEYVVGVVPPRIDGGSAERITQTDVDRALRDAQATMTSVGRQGGAPAGRGGVAAAPEPDLVAYAAVYYPGVISLDNALPVALRAGEERAGVDLRIEFVRTVKVEGTVVRADGQPPTGTRVALIPNGNALGTVSTPTSLAGGDGTFSLKSVIPGDYVAAAIASNTVLVFTGDGVTRTVGFSSGDDTSRAAAQSATSQAVLMDVSVGADGVSGLTLTLSDGQILTGRLVFDGAPSTARNPADYSVSISPRPDVTQAARSARGTVGPLGEFSMSGILRGRYSVYVTQVSSASPTAKSWVPSSIVVNGKEVIDSGLDVLSDGPLEATVRLTDRIASLTGVFQNSSGQPAPDYTMVLFPGDRSMWRWQSRHIKAVRPSSDGRYTFTDLPAGEYLLTAVTDIEPNEWFDPQYLERIAPAALRVTIAEGEKKVQDIRMR